MYVCPPEAAAEWLAQIDPVRSICPSSSRLLADPELVESAYKAAAHVYHPDKGGQPERFSQLSAAVEILRGYHRRRVGA